MVVLQTFLGFIIIYFVFCILIATSGNFDTDKEKGFILVSVIIGYIVALLSVIYFAIFLAYVIGSSLYNLI